MKKQQRKQKKVSMTSPSLTAVNTTPESFPPRTVGVPETYIGHILELFRERIANPPTTHLEENLDPPHSHVAKIVRTLAPSNEISEERGDYLTFCKRAGITPLPIRVCQSHDEKGYNHYAAYCATIGVEPRSIERWDSLRENQTPSGPTLQPSYTVDRGYRACTSPTGDPACFTRPTERPITFDKHLARAAYRPALQEVNRRERFKPNPNEEPLLFLLGMPLFEYSKQLNPQSIVNRKFKDPVATTPPASLMCVECCEYDAQPHWQNGKRIERDAVVMSRLSDPSVLRPSLILKMKGGYDRKAAIQAAEPYATVAHVNLHSSGMCATAVTKVDKGGKVYEERLYRCPVKIVPIRQARLGGFYPANDPLTIEWKARQLLLADNKRRAQEHLQSFLEYMNLNLTVNTILPHKSAWFKSRVVSLLHKAAWVDSFGGSFSLLLNRHIPSPLLTVVCDPEVLKQASLRFIFGTDLRSAYLRKSLRKNCLTRIVVDNLSPACTPHTRTHYGARSFIFSAGETIRMCSCTKFDKERKAVLRRGKITQATPGFIALWDATLKTHNLSEHRAGMPLQWVMGDLSERDAATTSTGRVKTAGWSGTEHDGSRGNSCSRDGRGERWFVDQQDKEPKTKSKCLKCRADIYAKAGTNFCPDTDCAQRFQEAWDGGVKKELFEAGKQEPVLMELFEHINRNRS